MAVARFPGRVSGREETEANMNCWDDIRIKSFCAVGEAVNGSIRQLTEWERYLPVTYQMTG